MKEELKNIIYEFQIEGRLQDAILYGDGHINTTYLVITSKKRYILQKINHSLFTEVDKLMNNIQLVTEYNRKITELNGGFPDNECLSLVYTNSGESYYYDSSGYYRIYKYIENSVYYQLVEKPNHFYESAVAFGNFASMLSSFDAEDLYEILPNFHNTVIRYENLKKSLNKDILNRAQEVQKEVAFIEERKDYYSRILSLLESGKMPKRVTHNDTKLNNVLFHKDTGKALAVIDYDTIMPGSICYDFGDAIRFGCNSTLEDERDLSKVHFRIDLFEVYAKGYQYSFGSNITEIEKDNLAYAALLITMENGMRFLTDYLDGDTYFRISRPKQNLDRTRTQLRLVVKMEEKYQEMQEIVNKYYKIYRSGV